MRLSLFAIIMVTTLMSLSAQEKSELDMLEQFISSAEQEGYELVSKQKCDRAPGEMCKLPFEITPDIHKLDIVVVGNKWCKPSLAIEDIQTKKIITYTDEYEVTKSKHVNFVRKTFNLKNSQMPVSIHFGNTRSLAPEDTYMLVFTK